MNEKKQFYTFLAYFFKKNTCTNIYCFWEIQKKIEHVYFSSYILYIIYFVNLICHVYLLVVLVVLIEKKSNYSFSASRESVRYVARGPEGLGAARDGERDRFR